MGGSYDEMVYKAEKMGYGFAFVYHYNLRKKGVKKISSQISIELMLHTLLSILLHYLILLVTN